MYCSSASSESSAIVCPHGFLGHRDQAADSLQTGSGPHGAPPLLPVPPRRPAAALDALRRLRPGTVAGFRAPMAGPIDTGPPTCPATTACPPRSLPLAPGRHDLSRGVGQSSRPGKHRMQGLIRRSRTSQFSLRLAKYACSASPALWNCADYHRASLPRMPPASQRC